MTRIQIQNLPNNSIQELKQEYRELNAVRGGCGSSDARLDFGSSFTGRDNLFVSL